MHFRLLDSQLPGSIHAHIELRVRKSCDLPGFTAPPPHSVPLCPSPFTMAPNKRDKNVAKTAAVKKESDAESVQSLESRFESIKLFSYI